MDLVAIDIESVNPTVGPLWAIGAVRVRDFIPKTITQFKETHRSGEARWPRSPELKQWVVRFPGPGAHLPLSQSGKDFWGSTAKDSRDFLLTCSSQCARDVALSFREYLDSCYETGASLAIGNIHTDVTLLNQFLSENNCRLLQYDRKNTYRNNLYVLPDMMRAAFSFLNPTYCNLQALALQGSIKKAWQQRYVADNETRAPLFLGVSTAEKEQVFRTYGPKDRHLPVWDAWTMLECYLMMEDLKHEWTTAFEIAKVANEKYEAATRWMEAFIREHKESKSLGKQGWTDAKNVVEEQPQTLRTWVASGRPGLFDAFERPAMVHSQQFPPLSSAVSQPQAIPTAQAIAVPMGGGIPALVVHREPSAVLSFKQTNGAENSIVSDLNPLGGGGGGGFTWSVVSPGMVSPGPVVSPGMLSPGMLSPGICQSTATELAGHDSDRTEQHRPEERLNQTNFDSESSFVHWPSLPSSRSEHEQSGSQTIIVLPQKEADDREKPDTEKKQKVKSKGILSLMPLKPHTVTLSVKAPGSGLMPSVRKKTKSKVNTVLAPKSSHLALGGGGEYDPSGWPRPQKDESSD